jgi:VIT1/CCC1 family predicted Fe2+/Mn2+ transporter
MRHVERHAVSRIGWLRAAILGANDGIISTASLIVGVAAANVSSSGVFLTGIAGLFAGALSMAAGEYVSVSSQADTERADIAREARELQDDLHAELNELKNIYLTRGLTPDLAYQVAEQLMARDALAAHTRDELHITETTEARPLQAAFASAAAFATGAALPLFVALIVLPTRIAFAVTVTSLIFLALLGAVGALVGRAPVGQAVLRITFWGAVAMLITAGVGRLFGAVV